MAIARGEPTLGLDAMIRIGPPGVHARSTGASITTPESEAVPSSAERPQATHALAASRVHARLRPDMRALHLAALAVLLQCGSTDSAIRDPNEPDVTLVAEDLPCDDSYVPAVASGIVQLTYRAGRTAATFTPTSVRYEWYVGDVVDHVDAMTIFPAGSGLLAPAQTLDVTANVTPTNGIRPAKAYVLVVELDTGTRHFVLRGGRHELLCRG